MPAQSWANREKHSDMAGLSTKIRRLSIVLHRDLGYFFSGLIIIYCLSGIALNHIEDWNPDFIIRKKTVRFDENYKTGELTKSDIDVFNQLVGEKKHKTWDIPVPGQLKIYYDNASLHLDFAGHTGVYEEIRRRPLFYDVNVLHKNSIRGWRWFSDVFALTLIVISISGMIILKGKKGFSGRGWRLVLSGFIPPVIAWIFFQFFSR